LTKESELPPLRDVIARHGIGAKKSLGQNFLLDLNITAKIARAAGNLADKNVIEIGPGPGGLTRALLALGARRVIAIERDARAIAALGEIAAQYPGRLHVVEDVAQAYPGRLTVFADDALKVDAAALCPAPRAIVANLPYNIATPLLVGWLRNMEAFESLTLMFQREVAERICAVPRTKDYGRLSVIAQWRAEAEKKFDLPPSAFTPPPQVTSTVVHLTPKKRTDAVPFEVMEKVTAAAFGQRRKMLRQSLKSLSPEAEKLLAAANLPPTARAEEIDIAGFVRLAEAYQAIK
jgi:16S rRNA (adenine1518-N6/adenine1519-N6)-dimethyltransferase